MFLCLYHVTMTNVTTPLPPVHDFLERLNKKTEPGYPLVLGCDRYLFCRLFFQEFGWTDIGNIYDTNLHLSRVTGSSLQASVLTVIKFVFMLNRTRWTAIESGHTIDELRVDEKLFETVFDFHLSPDWWQMPIENIVF